MRDKNVRNTREFREQHTRKPKLESINSKIPKIQKEEILSLEEDNIWENSFNAVSDWIVLSDLERRIIRTNKAGEKFTGLSCAEMTGKSCCKLIHNSKKQIPGCPMKQMINTGCRASSEIRLPDGNWILVTIEPVKDKENNIKAAVHIIRDITKQKNEEKKLRDSEKKFRSIFKHAHDGITYLDCFGKILDVNEKVLEIFGSTKEALLNKHFTKIGILFAKDIPKYLSLFQSILSGRERNVTVHIRNKKGREMFLECSASLIKSDVEPTRIMVITRDITERRQVEEALRASEERFKGIFENSLVGMYRTTPDGRILMANPAIVKMLGYNSFKELEERNLEEYGFTSEYPRSGFIKKIKNEGQIIGFESEWCKKDGSTLFVRESAQAIRDKKGNILYYEGTVEDITDRKKAEIELKESKARYELAQRIGGIGTWELNIETNNVYWSEEMESIFGFSEGQFDGTLETVKSYIHPEDYPLWQNSVQNCIENGIEHNLQYRIIWPDGSVHWIHALGNISVYEQSIPKKMLGIVADINEQKIAEKALRENEILLKETQKLVGLGGWECDIVQKKATWTDEVYNIYGVEKDFDISDLEKTLSFYQEEDRENLRRAFERCFSKHESYDMEVRFTNAQGKHLWCRTIGTPVLENGQVIKLRGNLIDITKQKKAEQEHLANFHFFESMDRVNRAIQGASNLEQMMSAVLDEVLSIFDCDRAALVYPCDPEAQFWTAPMERFRPPYKGVLALGLQVPMDDEVAFCHRLWRCSDSPVPLGREHEIQMPDGLREQFQIQTQLGMAIYPKDDRPWLFVIHQCSRSRFWRKREIRLLEEIGRRLTDGLTSLLMQRDLKANENKYRELADSITNIFFAMDQNLRVTYWNKASEEITGIQAEDALGKTHQELFQDKAWVKRVEKIYREVLKTQQPRTFINEIDQEVESMVHEVCAYPSIGGLSVFIKDITEREKAEQALRESEQLLNEVGRIAKIGGWEMDLITRKAKWTKGTYDIVEIGYDEPVPGPDEHVDYYLPEYRQIVEQAMKKLIEDDITLDFEAKLRTAKGNVKWCRAIGQAIRKDGICIKVFGTFHDITKRKQAEEEVSKLVKFPEENPHPVLRLTDDGTIIYSNKAGSIILETWDKKVGEYIPGDYQNKIKQVLQSGEVTRFEFECHNGRIFEITLAPVSEIGYINIYGLDITQRKYVEDSLLKYHEQLKSLASKLTITEERERYRIATELHDHICQSLAISKIKLETLMNSRIADEACDTLSEVCDWISQVINDTRTLTFDLSSPILHELGFEKAVAAWLEDEIQKKHNIQTEFYCDHLPKPLDDDVRSLLFRDVRELLINIIKHAQANSVKVSISRDASRIRVVVEDDGVGFDPVQVTAAAMSKAEFGLFSIRQRLEFLDGQFEIDSSPGKGCKITMIAPLKEVKGNDES